MVGFGEIMVVALCCGVSFLLQTDRATGNRILRLEVDGSKYKETLKDNLLHAITVWNEADVHIPYRKWLKYNKNSAGTV